MLIATPFTQALRRPIESAQYTSSDFTDALDDHGILASLGSTGDAYDNAMAESFVDSFKTELIRDRVFKTRSQLELQARADYLERDREQLARIAVIEERRGRR